MANDMAKVHVSSCQIKKSAWDICFSAPLLYLDPQKPDERRIVISV
jgi:hypothetical protein